MELDMVPGWGHEPQDFINYIQKLMERNIPHYKPLMLVNGCMIEHAVGFGSTPVEFQQPAL
jgi:hypothetical protein